PSCSGEAGGVTGRRSRSPTARAAASPTPAATSWPSSRTFAQERWRGRTRTRATRTLSGSTHDHEPRLRPALGERQVLEVGPDLIPRRLDGLDFPVPGEGGVPFPLRHPPRPLRARLLVREPEEEQ